MKRSFEYDKENLNRKGRMPVLTSKKQVRKRKQRKIRNSEYYDMEKIFDDLYAQGKTDKVFNHLMEIIESEENIKLAYRNIKRNSGSSTAGVDHRTIDNLAKLSEEEYVRLIRKQFSNYHPRPVRRVEIEKDNGKKRPLGIPTIVDRMVQQCILQVMEPICEAKFSENSNGFRPNRSAETAIAQCMRLIQVQHIQKYYGNEGNITKAIRDISFSVEAGEFLGIMGASGSGKTTLLNCISTIDTVSAGHIYLGGTDVTEIKPKAIARFRRENLGFVFQDFNLLDTLTISENIALALSINKTPARDVEPRIQDIAQKLNITDILNKYPYQVSGGQKQRCACARAIINNPKLLLADEPTGALDSHSAQMLLSTIQSINEQLGATILMVTHDTFTASYASRILFLQDGAIFTELRKGNDSRSAFFEKILNVLTMIGGGQSHVC